MNADFQLRNTPFVSIIILAYNSKNFIVDCLDSVLETKYPNLEVIVVDNRSTDNTLKLLTDEYGNRSNIKIIEAKRNLGFSSGNNLGAHYSSGEYLAFLNPDTEVEPNWLASIISFMESNTSVGIVQPKLLSMDRKHFDSAGGFINPCGIVFIRAAGKPDYGQYENSADIFYAKGAAFVIRRMLWNDLGGLDPIFFTYDEETDLCWRTWDSNYKVAYLPNSIVYHFGGHSLEKVPYQVKYHESRGRLILLVKNHSIKNLAIYLPITLVLYAFNILRYVLNRNSNAVRGIIGGCFWCIRNWKHIVEARRRRKPAIHHESEALKMMVSIPF